MGGCNLPQVRSLTASSFTGYSVVLGVHLNRRITPMLLKDWLIFGVASQ